MRWLAIVTLILAVPLAAYQAPPAGDKHEHSDKAAEHKDQEAQKIKESLPAVIEQQTSHGEPSNQPSRSETENSTDHPHDWIDKVNAFSTLTIAAFTIFLFIGVILQIKTSRDSVRSWVLVDRIGGPESWYNPTNHSYAPGAVFQFRIFGGTPVKIREARYALGPIPARQGTGRREPNFSQLASFRNDLSMAFVAEQGAPIPPDRTFQIRLSLRSVTLTENQWVDLRDGNTIMCAFGIVLYTDTFGRRKKTSVCYAYDFAFGAVVSSPEGTVLNPAGFYPTGPPAYNKAT